jgi:hypothetical protein
MKVLWKSFEPTFYTDLISFLLAIVALIISINKRRQNPKLRPLSIFFFGYAISQLLPFLNIALSQKFLTWSICRYTDFFDTIIEFLVFFLLIRNFVVNTEIKKVIRPLLPIFIISMFAYLAYYESTHREIDQYFLEVIYTIQASVLIIACVLYYVDLFERKPDLKLTSLPSFWAVTGILFFMLCTLPFSILGLYLIKTNYGLYVRLFSIFNIFYCILIIMLIKAYLCKPVAT